MAKKAKIIAVTDEVLNEISRGVADRLLMRLAKAAKLAGVEEEPVYKKFMEAFTQVLIDEIAENVLKGIPKEEN